MKTSTPIWIRIINHRDSSTWLLIAVVLVLLAIAYFFPELSSLDFR